MGDNMSKDRVEFKVPNPQKTKQAQANLEALKEAFDLPTHDAKDLVRSEKRVRCRPSQFARYLIYRNRLGGCNLFKNLDAEIFTPEVGKVVDLSTNIARHCS